MGQIKKTMKQEDLTGWGIALEGCEEFILDAFYISYNEMSNFPSGKKEPFQYLEIGVCEGRTISTMCKLFEALEIDYKAIGIDIENGFFNQEEWLINTLPFKDKITLNLKGSPEALKEIPNETIDLIFIDGNHSYNNVINDFKEADRIIKQGGIIMFHDSDIQCQGKDINEYQINGIEIRKALEDLEFIPISDFGLPTRMVGKYYLINDFENLNPDGRGIFIIQKIFLK